MTATEVTTEATVPAGSEAEFTYDRDQAAATQVIEAMTAYVRNTGRMNLGTLANFSEWWGTRGGVAVPNLGGDVEESWIDPAKLDEFRAVIRAKYGAELRNIRGRILTYVRQGYFTLAAGNELLAAGGLPEYHRPAESTHTYTVRLRGITLAVTGDTTAHELTTRVTENVRDAIASFGGDPAAYSNAYVGVEQQHQPEVDEDVTVAPLNRH